MGGLILHLLRALLGRAGSLVDALLCSFSGGLAGMLHSLAGGFGGLLGIAARLLRLGLRAGLVRRLGGHAQACNQQSRRKHSKQFPHDLFPPLSFRWAACWPPLVRFPCERRGFPLSP